MSSKELVSAALHFERPERLPVRMACLGVDDTAWIPRKTQPVDLDGQQADEWGCLWEKSREDNMGQVKGHPLESIAHLDRVVVPDYLNDAVFEGCEQAFEKAEKEGRYTQVGIFMILFERMHALAGFENVLAGLLVEPEAAAALADLILDAHLLLVRGYQERFGQRLHSFSMTEDWGTQQAAFISTDLWYEFFFPRYSKLFAAMHEGGQDVWVHSCGKVNELIQGFIDAGVDAMNLQQPRALGIQEIGARYRGKMTFESLSDIQYTLPKNDDTLIREDAQMLRKHWMLPSGGFVFSDYGDGEAIGAPADAKLKMYKAFSEVSEELYGLPLPKPRQANPVIS